MSNDNQIAAHNQLHQSTNKKEKEKLEIFTRLDPQPNPFFTR